MKNESGIIPLAYCVLVELDQVETTMRGLALPEETITANIAKQQKGTVVAIGEEAWIDESKPRANVGDRVYIKRFVGDDIEVEKDDVKTHYRLLMDKEVMAILSKDAK